MKKLPPNDYATALALYHFSHGFAEGILFAIGELRKSGSASEAIFRLEPIAEKAIERKVSYRKELAHFTYNEFLRFLDEAEKAQQD